MADRWKPVDDAMLAFEAAAARIGWEAVWNQLVSAGIVTFEGTADDGREIYRFNPQMIDPGEGGDRD